MLITFVGTLVMPLQFAVLLGVAISIVLYVSHQANRIKLVEIIPRRAASRSSDRRQPGYPATKSRCCSRMAACSMLPPRHWKRTCLPRKYRERHGHLFARGYDQFGSTMIGVLDRYTRTVQEHGGKVILAGISEGVLTQLERTGLLELIGKESIFMATDQFGMAANQAYEYAQKLLDEAEQR